MLVWMNDLKREPFSASQALWNAAIVVTLDADAERMRSFVHFPSGSRAESEAPQEASSSSGTRLGFALSLAILAVAAGALAISSGSSQTKRSR